MQLYSPSLNGLLALTSLGLFGAIGLYLLPLEPNLLALQFSFDQRAFQAVIAQWQGEALQRFKLHFWADFVLLLCYGLWGYGLMTRSRVARYWGQLWRNRAAWLMPLAATADALENLLQLYLLGQAAASPLLYALAGTAALTKWLLIGLFALFLVWAWLRRGRDS